MNKLLFVGEYLNGKRIVKGKEYYAGRIVILEDESGTYKIANNVYDEIASKYNFDYFKKLVPDCFKKIEIEKSYYEVTPFGRLFISACSSTTK